MEDKKVEMWLDNLKLFALNAEVHCSREERVVGQELVGTRNVNVAFDGMIKHMHADLNIMNKNIFIEPVIVPGGRQVLLFSIGGNNYYSDISEIHEIIKYPTNNYKQFNVEDHMPMVGILNWYEGLVPVMKTYSLLELEETQDKYLLVNDIGKEIYGFTVTDIYSKYEIERDLFGEELVISELKFKCIDFGTYEKQLINTRMNLKL